MLGSVTAVPWKRVAVWTMLLPLIGTLLLAVTVPGIGFLMLIGIALTPHLMLPTIYLCGFVPSLLTTWVFFAVCRTHGRWTGAAAACFAAAVTAAAWWTTLPLWAEPGSLFPTGFTTLMVGVAVASAAFLAFAGRRGER